MRFPHVRPAVSLAAGGFLVVSASSFGIVAAVTSGHTEPADGFAAMSAGLNQTAQARTSAFSAASGKQCETVQSSPTTGGGTGPSSGSTPPTSPPASSSSPPASSTSPSSSPTGSGTSGSGTTTPSPTTSGTSPSPSPSPSDTSGSPETTSLVTPLPASLIPGNAKQTVGTSAFAPEYAGTATLLSFARADAATTPELCVSLKRDETSVARGQKAQWNVNVWTTSGTDSNVKLQLATSLSSGRPVFTFGCPAEGKASCTFNSVDSQPRQMQAQVPVPKTATSVKSVRLTVTGSGANVGTKPKASVSIAVTAPKASASASASPSGSTSAPASPPVPAPGAAGLGPTGVTSPLPAGGLPFLNGGGSTLSPGGNASSLFPTLSPSAGAVPPASGTGSARTRPVADTLPGDASVMGAQYAGLGALALAFVLSVTRLSIRRRQAAKSGSHGSN